MRDLTVSVQAELAADAVTPVFLVQLDFDSATTRVWSGIGPLSYDSQTWTGVGWLGKVSALSESTSFVANGAAFELSGIPSALIALTLTEPYRGRRATLWLAFLDAANAVIADPVILFRGLIDLVEVDEGAETASIVINVESRAAELKRTRERRYTHQDQQIDFPGDRGLEFVAGLQDKQIVWRPGG